MKFLVIVSVFLSYLMCVRYSELDPDARPAVEKELSDLKVLNILKIDLPRLHLNLLMRQDE